MLFFRSEEHIERWCRDWNLARGGVLTLDLGWRLARAWFEEYRGAPQWRRRTLDETRALFAELGLSDDFWRL